MNTAREHSNRLVKALAIASQLHGAGVRASQAQMVSIEQGPFWAMAVKAAGRAVRAGKAPLSEETRGMALYFLACMEYRNELDSRVSTGVSRGRRALRVVRGSRDNEAVAR